MSNHLLSAFLSAPLDPAAVASLARAGLEPRLAPTDAREDFAAWLDVVRRGFLDDEATPEVVDSARERLGERRMTGIHDPAAPRPESPVGTIASWIAELSVPGGAAVPSCAISSVTVSPTHRRRGIARAMVEGELRLAASLGVPLSTLTVSESPLYGRYGFGPAVSSATIRLDVKRAAWTGPTPGGRVDFISRERFRELAPALHDRVRRTWPGEIEMPGGHWDRFAGTRPDIKDAGSRRAVQYADAGGEVRGLALYAVKENHDDFTKSTASIHLLLAETPGAYAALWRFFVDLDLVGTVEAGELSTDEPVLWMISDQRAATVTLRDHHYVRILDVPAALEARSYDVPGAVGLEVTDPLGIAGGRFVLTADASGRGAVSRVDELPTDVVAVRLGITELSTAYLGSVSLATLAAAGRVQTTDAEAAARMFAWHVPARLSFWY